MQTDISPGSKHRATEPLPAAARAATAGVHRADRTTDRVTDRVLAGVLLLTLALLAAYLVVR